MKKGIYIVSRIFPNTNGGTQHNYGLCSTISKYVSLEVFSYIDKKNYSMGLDGEKRPFNLHFYVQDKSVNKINTKLALINDVDRHMLNAIIDCIEHMHVEIVFFTIQMMGFYEILSKRYPNIRYIYVSHNVEYKNIYGDLCNYDKQNNVPLLKHYLKIIRIPLYEKKEKKAVKKSDYVFSIANSDSDILSEKFKENREKFILSKPQILYISPRDKKEKNNDGIDKSLLIVGNMSWFPTVAGTMWFIKNVYSKLVDTFPSLKLYVVGGNPPEDLVKCAEKYKGIIVTGFVDDLDLYYKKCDIAIVPIFEGTGAKIKVIEAVGKHIPCVISSFAAKDYKGIEKVAAIATNKESFIQQCLLLLESISKRLEMENELAEYYQEYMSDDKEIKKCLDNLLI